MDKIDAMLINFLQVNARTPLKSLASKVFLSAPQFLQELINLKNREL